MIVINREDAINYLVTNMNWIDEDGYTVDDSDEKREIIADLINGIPDADDGWILVEDKLPKIGYTVLATRFISKGHTYVDMASYQGQDIGWKSNFDTYYGTNPRKVIAWMPLPKPYEPKEDKC